MGQRGKNWDTVIAQSMEYTLKKDIMFERMVELYIADYSHKKSNGY